jgi:hypothetical protein
MSPNIIDKYSRLNYPLSPWQYQRLAPGAEFTDMREILLLHLTHRSSLHENERMLYDGQNVS